MVFQLKLLIGMPNCVRGEGFCCKSACQIPVRFCILTFCVFPPRFHSIKHHKWYLQNYLPKGLTSYQYQILNIVCLITGKHEVVRFHLGDKTKFHIFHVPVILDKFQNFNTFIFNQ